MDQSYFHNGHNANFNPQEQQRLRDRNDYSPYRDQPSPGQQSTSPPPLYAPYRPTNPAAVPLTSGYSPSPDGQSPGGFQPQWQQSSHQPQQNPFSDQAAPSFPPPGSLRGASPPQPPPHRGPPSGQAGGDGRFWGGDTGYAPVDRPQSEVTDGMDNFGQYSQGGGLNRVAAGVAEGHPRESGVEAMNGMNPAGHYGAAPHNPQYYNGPLDGYSRGRGDPYSHGMPSGAGAYTPGTITPEMTPRLNPHDYPGQQIPLRDYPSPQPQYQDSPYLHASRNYQAPIQQASIDPYSIADDGDDGFIPDPKRRSVLNLGKHPSRDALPGAGAGAANNGFGSAAGDGPGISGPATAQEKSEWLSKEKSGSSRMKWIVGLLIGGVIALAIAGGVVGAIIALKHKGSSSSSSKTSNGDSKTIYNKDSSEIQALMNNKNLHKVFPAMDYTPWGTQYPLCMTYPPIQNNVTQDIAVLSQLTNQVRLYGTDCNQTEMVLEAISLLGLTDMTVWLGVWIETNETTNQRQTSQMYNILDNTKDHSIFEGVIFGNEALFRAGADKAASEADLISRLTALKSNFTSKGWNLPVATSDLGDNWNAQITDAVDIVMSNIHPFFAGVNVDQAASWTWEFWQTHDVVLTQGTQKKNLISETGWPSGGGNDCGVQTESCPNDTAGSVAGIDQMNTFMSDWVCQALANGTDYFWFEAFDEPWKVIYNTPGKDWETQWGLMDPGRNLKDGLTIPDCGGKTVTSKRRR